MADSNTQNFFNTRFICRMLTVVGLLLFALPFVEIKMGDLKIGARGIDLITSKENKMDLHRSNGGFFESFSSSNKTDHSIYILAAAILAFMSLVVSYIKNVKGLQAILVLLAAIALIIFFIQLRQVFDTHTNLTSIILLDEYKITLVFSIWFYLSVICFAAAAFCGFKTPRKTMHETPPKNAPQLPIQNPGEQSEFPTSASESEVG